MDLSDVWLDPVQGLGASGMQFAILAVLTIIFIITLFYMAAIALRNNRLKRWLMGELMQTFASALMILGLVLFIAYVTDAFAATAHLIPPPSVDASWGFTAPSVTSPLDYVYSKLFVLDQQMAKLYLDVVHMNMFVERAEWTCFIFFGTEIHCGWDKHPLVESLHAIAYKLVQYRVALHGAMLLVNYIQDWFLPLFLPIGIILRAIPFTRGAGGLVIALVLGFYFIFPIMFVMGDLLMSQQLIKLDTSGFVDLAANTCVYSDLTGIMTIYVQDLFLVAQAELLIANAQSLLATLILETLLTPLMALAVTILFVRAISPILGSESRLVMHGLSKML